MKFASKNIVGFRKNDITRIEAEIKFELVKESRFLSDMTIESLKAQVVQDKESLLSHETRASSVTALIRTISMSSYASMNNLLVTEDDSQHESHVKQRFV